MHSKFQEWGHSERLDNSQELQQSPDNQQRRSGTDSYRVTLCQARKFPNVYSHIFSKGPYLLFDLQGPGADRPSRLTTARPGQLCPGPLLLPSADPAFSSRLLAQLSVYMFPNSRRKSEYQTDLCSFEVAKGCYQVWRGGVVPLRLVCLSLVLLCRPLTNHSNLQSNPNPNGAASLELAPLPGLGCYVLNHFSVWFSDTEVSLFF